MSNNGIWKAIAERAPADLIPTTIVTAFFIIMGSGTIGHLVTLPNELWKNIWIGVYMSALTATTIIFICSVVWHFRYIKHREVKREFLRQGMEPQDEEREKIKEIQRVNKM